MSRKQFSIILTATLLAIVCVAANSCACTTVPITEANVFQPKRSVTPESFDHPRLALQVHRVAATDGTKLDVWHLTQPDAEATVLFFGGQGFYLVQSIEYIEALSGLGLNILMWDYRGYGRSEGSPTVASVKGDSLQIYDYARNALNISEDTLVLHGHSLGSFLATYTASERQAAALVLENPVSSVNDWSEGLLPTGLNLLLSFEPDEDLARESNLDPIGRFDRALLIVAGSDDFVAPADMARELHRRAEKTVSKELVIIEGGGHNGLHGRAEYSDAYTKLIERL